MSSGIFIGPNVGERDAHVFGLTTVIAARGVAVPEDPRADGRRGIGVLAVAVELPLAEEALAARDVEGDGHPVATLQRSDRRPELLHHPHELVPEGRAHPGVRDEAVIEVNVRPADRRAGDPQQDVVGVLQLGLGLLGRLHPGRSEIRHRQHRHLLAVC
jgi:hypothetical protein